jgi:hypothetical protein
MLFSRTMKRPHLISSPIFIIGLGLMLFNDVYLKPYWANGLSGKLSDITGLFLFAVFIAAFCKQARKWPFWATGLLFIFWKSALSQPLINCLHHLGVPVLRTVDYTDLFALPVLVLAYWYSSTSKFVRATFIRPVFMAPLSLLIFCSDSIATGHYMPRTPVAQHNSSYDNYYSKLSNYEIFGKLDRAGIHYFLDSIKFGSYYYDTSGQSNTRVVVNERGTFYFWRIKDFVSGNDTISNINFVLGTTKTMRYQSTIKIYGFDVGKVNRNEDWTGDAYGGRLRLYEGYDYHHYHIITKELLWKILGVHVKPSERK